MKILVLSDDPDQYEGKTEGWGDGPSYGEGFGYGDGLGYGYGFSDGRGGLKQDEDSYTK